MAKKSVYEKRSGELAHIVQFIEDALTAVEMLEFEREKLEQDTGKMSAADAARFMGELQKANEQADELKSSIGKVYDWSRMALVPLRMEDEGLELLKIEGVGRVSLTSDINVSIIDKDEEFKWLEKSGHGDLITETVNASSLKALLRRLIRDGKEVPDKIFKVTPFTRASITKS